MILVEFRAYEEKKAKILDLCHDIAPSREFKAWEKLREYIQSKQEHTRFDLECKMESLEND